MGRELNLGPLQKLSYPLSCLSSSSPPLSHSLLLSPLLSLKCCPLKTSHVWMVTLGLLQHIRTWPACQSMPESVSDLLLCLQSLLSSASGMAGPFCPLTIAPLRWVPSGFLDYSSSPHTAAESRMHSQAGLHSPHHSTCPHFDLSCHPLTHHHELLLKCQHPAPKTAPGF